MIRSKRPAPKRIENGARSSISSTYGSSCSCRLDLEMLGFDAYAADLGEFRFALLLDDFGQRFDFRDGRLLDKLDRGQADS